MSERSLIDWLRSRICPTGIVQVGPGDDAAVLAPAGDGRVVVTTDAFLEGTHFAADDPPDGIGHKVIAASVSDIAAMGCIPTASFVTLGLCRARDDAFVRELGEYMITAAERYGAPITGGDVTSWDQPCCISVTVLGRPAACDPVLRSGAKPGDLIFVTGSLGGSMMGRHLTAQPRIAEGLFLAEEAQASAMIDVSDGVSTDLGHIARESGVGAVIRDTDIPVSDAARQLEQKDGRPALGHALHDGEDFELLCTVPPDKASHVRELWPFETPITEIGEITGANVLIEHADGSRSTLKPQGYEHTWHHNN
jgi:thiamine-monophosphate kinase